MTEEELARHDSKTLLQLLLSADARCDDLTAQLESTLKDRALPAVQPDAAAIREVAQDSEPLPPTSDLPMSLHRWQAWIDDLPLPEDFDAGIAGLQEYLFSLALPAVQPDLTDPVVVHANMLRGAIAKPTLDQIIHLYGVDALCRALVPVIVKEAALDEMARLGQEFDAAMKGETP